MPAFKLFLQIVNSKKYMIILYYGIFLVIFLLISGLTAQSAEGQYEETSLNVGVIDRDHSLMSKGLLAFLDDSHTLTDINDGKNAMQDALYRQEVSCLLIIPKGFGLKFASDGSIPLQSVSSPDNAQAGPLITSQLNDYLGNVSAYMDAGSTEEEALASARSLASIRTDIAFQDGQQVTSQDQLPGSYYYFLFYSYISVSYTHLDVYKRQRVSTTASPSSAKNCINVMPKPSHMDFSVANDGSLCLLKRFEIVESESPAAFASFFFDRPRYFINCSNNLLLFPLAS